MSALELGAAERAHALEVAERIARRAGGIAMEHFGRLENSEIRSKEVARDLVTAADLASERAVVAELRSTFPGHAIESEEEVCDGGEDGFRWFLDPIDGTVNFVHGLPCFAVSLALYGPAGGEVAVVHAPRLQETFTAARGGGAFLDGRRLSVSPARDLADCMLATGFPYRLGELACDNLANFCRFFYEVRGMRRMGSAALDLAYTAAGRFDGFWELHLAPHDVAAGALLVQEAGGVVSDVDGADHWLRSGHIVAAGPGVHESIRRRLEH